VIRERSADRMGGGPVTIGHAALPGVRREVVMLDLAAREALGAERDGTFPLRASVRGPGPGPRRWRGARDRRR
jgi:hypothetical protein